MNVTEGYFVFDNYLNETQNDTVDTETRHRLPSHIAASFQAAKYIQYSSPWVMLLAGNVGNVLILVVMLSPKMRSTCTNLYLAGNCDAFDVIK